MRANQGYDCTLVQAARATTATPGLFKPIVITVDGFSETLVGACLGFSSISSVLLQEAGIAFKLSQQVACLVSIGAGNTGPIPTKLFNNKIVKLLF